MQQRGMRVKDIIDGVSDGEIIEYYPGKVYSLIPSVEVVDGELWGVMTAGLKEALSGEETATLMEYVCGQNSDGYGEGLEQRPINTPEGEIYVSFWDSGNSR